LSRPANTTWKRRIPPAGEQCFSAHWSKTGTPSTAGSAQTSSPKRGCSLENSCASKTKTYFFTPWKGRGADESCASVVSSPLLHNAFPEEWKLIGSAQTPILCGTLPGQSASTDRSDYTKLHGRRPNVKTQNIPPIPFPRPCAEVFWAKSRHGLF